MATFSTNDADPLPGTPNAITRLVLAAPLVRIPLAKSSLLQTAFAKPPVAHPPFARPPVAKIARGRTLVHATIERIWLPGGIVGQWVGFSTPDGARLAPKAADLQALLDCLAAIELLHPEDRSKARVLRPIGRESSPTTQWAIIGATNGLIDGISAHGLLRLAGRAQVLELCAGRGQIKPATDQEGPSR